MHEPQVLHLEFSCKVLLARHDQLIITNQYEIINIKYDDQQLTFHHDVVQVHIRFTLCEAQLSEVVVVPSVPSTRWLLQPVRSSLESAHMRLTIEGLKTFQPLNVHLFLNLPIEECSLHIHLMDLPTHLS